MKKPWGLLFFSLLIGLGFNLAHPVTPAYLRTLEISSFFFGILFASMNIGQFIMAPVWGSLGDSKNRKVVLLIGLIGYGTAQALFGYVTNIYVIILIRFIGGVFASSLLTNALAHISNNPEYTKNRASLISLMVAFNVMGSTLGYYIGGTIGDYFVGRENEVMYIQALYNYALAIWVYLCLHLNEPIKPKFERQSALKQLASIKKLSPELFLLMVIIALVSVAQTNFGKYVDLYLTDLHYSPGTIGSLVFFSGLVTLTVNFLLVPILLKKFNETKVLTFAIFLQALFSLLTFSFDQSRLLDLGYTLFMVYIAGKAIYEPMLATHLSKYDNVSPGILMGSRQSAISLGAILGPIAAGFVYGWNPQIMFISLALLLFIAGTLFILYERRLLDETIER